jgi:3-mercaptopyruvate sulfurtransferase SseA
VPEAHAAGRPHEDRSPVSPANASAANDRGRGTGQSFARHSHHRRFVDIDASWIYGPFNSAGIDVRARYRQAHLPGSWFLDLGSLARAYPAADRRVDALTRPPRVVVRELLAPAAPTEVSPIVITDMDGGCTTAPLARLLLMDAGYQRVQLLNGTPASAHRHGSHLTDR